MRSEQVVVSAVRELTGFLRERLDIDPLVTVLEANTVDPTEDVRGRYLGFRHADDIQLFVDGQCDRIVIDTERDLGSERIHPVNVLLVWSKYSEQ